MVARLEMRAVEQRFGATRALDGVDFDVAPGEVPALIGENGAGKSPLMKTLPGVGQPDAGAMRVDCGLRVGEYRVLLVYPSENVIEVRKALHRSEAYR